MAAARRRKARELALQMLYQQDLNPDIPADVVRQQIVERLGEEDVSRFAWSLFAGVIECRAALDARIEATATNWSLRRMPPTDRNVLRLGAFELLHTDTPPRVVIDEALELAKRFGSAQSSQFVNGILDRLIPGGGRGGAVSEPAEPT
jgi:N utilization substance protein B